MTSSAPARPTPPFHGLTAHPRLVLGAIAILLACLAFGGNSVLVKVASGRYDPFALSLVRFMVGVVGASLGAALTGRKEGAWTQGFRVSDWPGLVCRAIFGTAQMLLFFVGVALTSSGRATLLMCTHPLFAALFGLLFFGERLPRVVFAGILAGFAGAVVVFWDGSTYSLMGNLISLAGGAANGISMHFVRRVRQNHSAFLVYLAPSVLGLLICSFALPSLGGIPLADLGLMVLIGFLSFLGQILVGFGLKYLPATAGSMLGLSEVVFALSLSALFLHEVMSARFLAGTAIILGGLGVVIWAVRRAREPQSLAQKEKLT